MINDINKILNLLHPLLKRYYYNKDYEYPHSANTIEELSMLMESYDAAHEVWGKEASNKATEHIKKLFPDFKKIEVDG